MYSANLDIQFDAGIQIYGVKWYINIQSQRNYITYTTNKMQNYLYNLYM